MGRKKKQKPGLVFVEADSEQARIKIEGDEPLVQEVIDAIPNMMLRLRAKRSPSTHPPVDPEIPTASLDPDGVVVLKYTDHDVRIYTPPTLSEKAREMIAGGSVGAVSLPEPTLSDAELFAEDFITENAKTMYTEALVSGHPTPDTVGAMTFAQAMSPDAPTVVNEHGGKQSHLPFRLDLIDGKAMMRMAEVLDQGATKYGVDNWRLISIPEHLNHALAHIFAWLAGDRSDDHLSHALCRTTFAVAVDEQPDHAPLSPDDPRLAHLKIEQPEPGIWTRSMDGDPDA